MCSPLGCTSYVTVIRESKANAAKRDEIAIPSRIWAQNSEVTEEGAAVFAARMKKLIPTLLPAEFGDVRGVVPAVPRI
jgi:hypothetical protein